SAMPRIEKLVFQLDPIDMAQVAVRIDAVAHQLLQDPAVGEAAVALALPDQLAIEADFENAAGAGDEGDGAQLEGEGGEYFLRHPGGAQHPVALGAIGDGEGWLAGFGHFFFLPASAGSTRLARI